MTGITIPQAIPAPLGTRAAAPGTPAGPGGAGGTTSPGAGSGWEIFVLSHADFATVLCKVPITAVISWQFAKQLDDLGSGTVVLTQDDPWWKTTKLPPDGTYTGSLDSADGTFESGVTSWAASGAGAPVQSSAQAHSGSFSALLTSTGTLQVTLRPTARVPVVPGFPYTATMWVFSTTASITFNPAIDWYTSSGTYISTSSGGIVTPALNTWTQLTVTATAPATAAQAVYGPTQHPTAGGQSFYADDVHITGSTAGPATEILDFECVWQFRQDGVPRFEFLGETVTEQLIDPSEQRQVTITGPGTIAALKWAMCAPHGFPNIRLKLDGIQDSFSEVDANGNGVLDTNIWNAVSPSADVFITPVQGAFSFPGGFKFALNTLFPSGSVTLSATPGTTVLGATPYDATDTLISAQVSPVGLTSGTTGIAGLDGSQLTQFYIQSIDNTSNYALFGLSATAFYAQLGSGGAVQTKTLSAYDPNNHAHWMITEQAGTGGGNGTFYFWTSPDGSNWTLQWQVVHTWDARNCGFYFAAAYDVANSQAAQLTNLNGNVTTPSYQGEIYLATPVMGIWFDQWAKAQARGTIPFTTTTMGPAADSFGNPWTDSQNFQTVNGTDLFAFLQGCAQSLNADYVMQPGFVLQVGIPTSTSISLGTQRQGQVIFRDGRDAMSKQRVRQRNQIQNLIGAENQDGHEISATNGTSIASWGQREAWYHTGNQVDPASMSLAAAAAAASNALEIPSVTLRITPNLAGRTVFQSFDVGDWVGVERPDFSAVDADRVIGIAIQVDPSGNETHELILLTYVQWLEQELTFVQNQLGGNFVSVPGLTPVAASRFGTGQVATWFSPAQQLATLANVNLNNPGPPYTGGALVYNPVTGQYHQAGSTDPTTGNLIPLAITGSGGTSTVTPGGVVVSTAAPVVAPDGSGAQPAASTVTTSPTQTVTVINGVTRTTMGVQADGSVTTVDSNAPAPATPDTPSVAAVPLGISITWDGLLGGAAPLADFYQIQFHVSTTTGFSPSAATLVDHLTRPGTITLSGLSAGVTYYAKLVALNSSGASSTSAQASAVPLAVATSNIALTASLIGNIGVLNANPYFWGGDGTGWASAGGGAFSVVTGAALPAGTPYTYGGRVITAATEASIEESGQQFLVNPGAQYLVTAWVYCIAQSAAAALTGTGTLRVTPPWVGSGAGAHGAGAALTGTGTLNPRPAQSGAVQPVRFGYGWSNNGSFVSASYQVFTIPTGTWVPLTTVQTAPASGVNEGFPVVRFPAGTTGYAVAILCLPQVPGALLQAGTVTATQIAAGIVVAGIVNGTLITGAQIVADGSSDEFLVYNGTPATGNLLASVSAAATTDSHSNTVRQYVTAYGTGGSASYVQLAPGNPAQVTISTGDASEAIVGSVGSIVNGSGTTRSFGSRLKAPQMSGFPLSQARVDCQSFSADGTTAVPEVAIEATDGTIVGFVTIASNVIKFFSNTEVNCAAGGSGSTQWDLQNTGGNGFVLTTNQAFAGFPPIAQTDTTTNTLGNSTSATALTALWNIPASNNVGDGLVGTIYEIEVPVQGVWESGSVLNLGLLVDATTYTNVTPVAAGFTAGHNFAGTIRLKITYMTLGLSGTINIDMDGTINDSSINRTPAGSCNVDGHVAAHTFNTTISHTVQLAGDWSAAVTGQTVSGITSKFTRIGP